MMEGLINKISILETSLNFAESMSTTSEPAYIFRGIFGGLQATVGVATAILGVMGEKFSSVGQSKDNWKRIKNFGQICVHHGFSNVLRSVALHWSCQNFPERANQVIFLAQVSRSVYYIMQRKEITKATLFSGFSPIYSYSVSDPSLIKTVWHYVAETILPSDLK